MVEAPVASSVSEETRYWEAFEKRIRFLTVRQKEGLLRECIFRAILSTSGEKSYGILERNSRLYRTLLRLAEAIGPEAVVAMEIDLRCHLPAREEKENKDVVSKAA